MTLLNDVMERPLDPGYAAASARRVEHGGPASTSTRGILPVTAAVVVGLLLTTAALQLRTPDPAASRARDTLQQQIEQGTQEADARQEGVAIMRAEIEQIRSSALEASGSQVADRVEELAVVVGAAPVTGSGVELSMSDSPRLERLELVDDPAEREELEKGRVFDSDVQLMVNGLWDAGAEAISVNDQRLTSLSAIRSAGLAILVDFRPLVPPYVIRAIGDPGQLQAKFAQGRAGSALQSLQDNHGIQATITAREDLELPGAGSLILREVRTEPPDDGPPEATQ